MNGNLCLMFFLAVFIVAVVVLRNYNTKQAVFLRKIAWVAGSICLLMYITDVCDIYTVKVTKRFEYEETPEEDIWITFRREEGKLLCDQLIIPDLMHVDLYVLNNDEDAYLERTETTYYINIGRHISREIKEDVEFKVYAPEELIDRLFYME